MPAAASSMSSSRGMSPDVFSTDGSAVGAFGTVDDQAFGEDGSEIVAKSLTTQDVAGDPFGSHGLDLLEDPFGMPTSVPGGDINPPVAEPAPTAPPGTGADIDGLLDGLGWDAAEAPPSAPAIGAPTATTAAPAQLDALMGELDW